MNTNCIWPSFVNPHQCIIIRICVQNYVNGGKILNNKTHYSDDMSTMASQITGVLNVCSTVCSGADQKKNQSSASLAFVKGESTASQSTSNAENVSIWWRHHETQDTAHIMYLVATTNIKVWLISYRIRAKFEFKLQRLVTICVSINHKAPRRMLSIDSSVRGAMCDIMMIKYIFQLYVFSLHWLQLKEILPYEW